MPTFTETLNLLFVLPLAAALAGFSSCFTFRLHPLLRVLCKLVIFVPATYFFYHNWHLALYAYLVGMVISLASEGVSVWYGFMRSLITLIKK